MVSILHISDPHAQTEVMIRLGNLANSLPDCDVLALTGDCTSTLAEQLDDSLNEWPQKLKLSVAGNHDFADTFDHLSTWNHHAPWSILFEEILFVGLDSSGGFTDAAEQLTKLQLTDNPNAIVLLSHRWPDSYEANALETLLSRYSDRPLLVLHGHEHPWSFGGLLWEESVTIGNRVCYRSKVCSSVSSKRGLGHLITWDNGRFACTGYQGLC